LLKEMDSTERGTGISTVISAPGKVSARSLFPSTHVKYPL
jgi:hypothetical protein